MPNNKAKKEEMPALEVFLAKEYDTRDLKIMLFKAAAGDDVAFGQLYEQFYHHVYRVCLRILKNSDWAQDTTQEAFISLTEKLKSFRGDSSFTTWLHRFTVNQVLMHFRKKHLKFEVGFLEDLVPIQIVLGTKNPRRMRVDDKIALEQAINLLPKGYKKVFILHEIHGYEHTEIGHILGCSDGTSKSQLSKAKQRLKTLLQKKAPPRLLQSDLDELSQKSGKPKDTDKVHCPTVILEGGFNEELGVEFSTVTQQEWRELINTDTLEEEEDYDYD